MALMTSTSCTSNNFIHQQNTKNKRATGTTAFGALGELLKQDGG